MGGYRRMLLLTGAFAGTLLAAIPARGAIIAGVNSPYDAGAPDAWYHILYVDEANPFDFSGTGRTSGYATEFTAYLEQNHSGLERVTPFVVEPHAANDFTVRAIGTTRVEDVDWTSDKTHTFAFHDSQQPVVHDGWMAGILTSDPDGTNPGSPVPFGGGGREGWLTGTSAEGGNTPRLVLDQPPVPGDSRTFPDGLGRTYQFNVGAEPIPEPAAFLLLGICATVCLLRRR